MIAASSAAGCSLKPSRSRSSTNTGLPPAEQHHFRIADPVGRRDDDLVAGVQRRQKRVEEDLLAAGADDGLLGLVVEIVLALEFRGDRLLQSGMPSTAVYLVSPRWIASIAAFLMLSGVSKSGSPAPRPITSRPASFQLARLSASPRWSPTA